MSGDTLHAIANEDTPAAVNVPRDMHGLLVWAVGRFGSGIVLAGCCAWALTKVYEDHSRQTERLMVLLEARARADSELAGAIVSLKGVVEEMAREARMAHRGAE